MQDTLNEYTVTVKAVADSEDEVSTLFRALMDCEFTVKRSDPLTPEIAALLRQGLVRANNYGDIEDAEFVSALSWVARNTEE